MVNLGTPATPTAKGVRAFLRQFLSDRRVIELTPFLWQIILNCFILPFRPRVVAKKYATIWREDDLSPLDYYTQSLSNKIQESLNNEFPDKFIVRHAYSYGKLSIAEQCHQLQKLGCREIIIAPMYPQYSATTTASVVDSVAKYLLSVRHQPNIQIIKPYYDNQDYIKYISETILPNAQNYDKILLSFHGLPKENVLKGDPYACHCRKSARLIQEYLNIKNCEVVFQSRFGPKEWLQPYAAEVIAQYGKENKSVLIISPGFATDCLETLEEIQVELNHLHQSHTNKSFQYIPCLNDSVQAVDLWCKMIKNYAR